MILFNSNLYTLLHYEVKEDLIIAQIQLQKEHAIFKGHFPNQPILPGVCMLQISQEILQRYTLAQLFLYETGQIKFLKMVAPNDHNPITIHINTNKELRSINIQWLDENNNSILKFIASYKIEKNT